MPLRADGSPLRAFRSPGLRIAAPAGLPEASSPQWRLLDGGSPLTVARQLRFRTGFPWCPARILAVWEGRAGSGEPQVRRLPRDGYGKVKAVGPKGQLQVGWREAWPPAAHRSRVTVAAPQRLEEPLDVRPLAPKKALHVLGAGVILGMVGRGDEGQESRAL